MYIISGNYKGRKLETSLQNQSFSYRPTMTKIRASLFNILEHANYLPYKSLSGLTFLDICCGNGACGFEAISRGVTHTTFIDKSAAAIALVRLNASKLALNNTSISILKKNVMCLPLATIKHHIVYIDPPYLKATKILPICFNILHEKSWLYNNALVIVETDTRSNFYTSENNFSVLYIKRYGSTMITVAQYKTHL